MPVSITTATASGYMLCEPTETATGAALRHAMTLLNATPLDHPERAQVEALHKTLGRALRIAQELDWETWAPRKACAHTWTNDGLGNSVCEHCGVIDRD